MLDVLVVTAYHSQLVGYQPHKYRAQSVVNNYNAKVVINRPELVELLGVPVEDTILIPFDRGSANLAKQLIYFFKVLLVIFRLRPRVVYYQSAYFSTFGWLWPGKSVYFWNEHPSHRFKFKPSYGFMKNKLWCLLIKLCYFSAKRAYRVMPNSIFNYQDLVENGVDDKKVEVIPIGVDESFVVGERNFNDSGPLKFVYTGTVSKGRGRDVMLQAVSLANREVKIVHLSIIGINQGEMAICKRMVTELGIEDSVELVGRVDGNKLPGLLLKADVGICIWDNTPYYRNNPPTKLFEYLVSGMPIIASNIRTHTEYLKGWPAEMIFEYDAEDLARTFKFVAENRRLLPSISKTAKKLGDGYLWSTLEPRFLSNLK